MASWTANDIPDLTGRTAIVTGANSGIGLETARGLARHGARVILATRSEERGRRAVEAVGRLAEWGRLDLADLGSIRAFAESFTTTGDSLDILVNNAGLGLIKRDTTVDGFERVFGTNHLGHFALTAQLYPKLTDEAQVVTVSSDAHQGARIDFDDLQGERKYRRWAAYGQSKLANLLFAFELQRRITRAGRDQRSVAIHPGVVASNFGPGSSAIGRAVMKLIASTPERGALPSLFAATSDQVVGGDYIVPGKGSDGPRKIMARPPAYDEADAARLWEVSEALTGTTFTVR